MRRTQFRELLAFLLARWCWCWLRRKIRDLSLANAIILAEASKPQIEVSRAPIDRVNMQTPHRKPRRQLISYNPRIPARFIVGPHSPIIPFVLMFFASCVCAHNKINRQKRLRRSSWCELESTTTNGRRRRGKRRKIESFLRLPPSVHRLLWIWKIFSLSFFFVSQNFTFTKSTFLRLAPV